jgi:hypothetical protein
MLLSPYLLRLLVLKYLLTLRFKIFEKPGSPGLENFGVLILAYVLRIITLLNLKKTTSELYAKTVCDGLTKVGSGHKVIIF